ncbi:MAG: flavodoxin family protein [Candidatus Omnitrophica bacterium]|nr:flavodoxin family protein [Candidatus Omnitrophota bacterium]
MYNNKGMGGMYVLGISGSPKVNGLTSLLLDKALLGAKASGAHTEKIILNDLNFKACQECGGCGETGVCILDDDMRPIYEKLAKADAVIAASPIYFGNITAQLKAMIDRCHSTWMAKYILNRDLSGNKKRRGIFLCVSGKESEEYFESAKKIIKIFFITGNIEYSSDLFVPGLNTMSIDDPKREAALKKAFQLGVNLIS